MEERYRKLESEKDFEYGLRLIEIKMSEKPNDLDWQDIVNLCKMNVHYDTLRKACQGEFGSYAVMQYLKNNKLEKITPITQLSEIKEKVGELNIIKKQVQTEKSELRKIQNSFVKSITIAEELENIMEENNYQVIIPEHCKSFVEENSDYEMILNISDWHIGYVIDDCKGNYYNWEIANERVNKLIDECDKYIKLYNINKIYVVNTGDTIEHLSMRKNQSQFCEFNQAQQINKAIEIIYRLLVALCEKKCNVEYDSIYGNHDRTNGDYTENLDGDNADTIIREQISKYKVLSGNNRLTVIDRKHTSKEIIKEIKGIKCKFVHGDKGVKDGKVQIKNEISMDNEIYDLYFKGHLHNFSLESENNGRYIISTGCLTGYNDYSTIFGCTTVASQTIVVLTDNKVELIKDVQLQ